LKDFNTRSFRDSLAPLVVTTLRVNYSQAYIKLTAKNVKLVMLSIENLNDKVADFYKQENQLAYLHKIFAGIAIFLSCLDLCGLASFMQYNELKKLV
jgi:putative ABC transport system permease protein